MPLAGQSTADVVRTAARLHSNDTGRVLGAELDDGVAMQAPT